MGTQQSYSDSYDRHIEELRVVEYPSLIDTTYLDHAGTTLYSHSLLDAYHQDLKSNLYGNPHSDSPASNLSTQKVDQARLSVLEYFNADPEHFDVVFTANATAAVKLVADCFRDRGFWYGFHKDAHSSIVGVREVATLGSRCFASTEEVEEWISHQQTSSDVPTKLSLFAYPAQSNMTGYRPPLSWSRRIRDMCSDSTKKQHTYVLLDAASYLTTGRLDLGDPETSPDFVAMSFYKIFGFPDLGALIVRRTARDVLSCRRYFGGGTVDTVTVIDSAFHAKKTDNIHDFLEDGTLPFHNIVALTYAISIHRKLFISAQAISNHTSHLSACLHQHLVSMQHFNGMPVVQLYNEADGGATYGDPKSQGPIFAFSVMRSDGSFVGKSHLERLAIECGFQIRTGGVCNPGGIATMLGLTPWELKRNFIEGARCGGDIDLVCGKPTGIIRVSLGAMSTLGDVRRFAKFIQYFFVEKTAPPPSTAARVSGTATTDAPALRDLTCVEHEIVLPIKGCPATHRDVHHQDLRAYQVWHQQWCVVESKTSGIWQEVTTENHSLQTLSCSLEPEEEGVLRITQPGSGRADLRISLWDRPSTHTNTERNASLIAAAGSSASPISSPQTPFDVYTDHRIERWLSSALGVPCTLARYRGQNAKTLPEARTCVISTCSERFAFATKDDLFFQHYKKAHAVKFLDQHPFPSRPQPQPSSGGIDHDNNHPRGHRKQQASTTTSIESKDTAISRQLTIVTSVVFPNYEDSLGKSELRDGEDEGSSDQRQDQHRHRRHSRRREQMTRWKVKLAALLSKVLC